MGDVDLCICYECSHANKIMFCNWIFKKKTEKKREKKRQIFEMKIMTLSVYLPYLVSRNNRTK